MVVWRVWAPKIIQKSSKNVTENGTEFRIDFLVILGPFWLHFGSILGAKMAPKSMKKKIRNSEPKKDFWRTYNAKPWFLKGLGSKNNSKIDLLAHFSSPGHSWEPKWPQDPSQGLLGLPKPHFLSIFNQFWQIYAWFWDVFLWIFRMVSCLN